MLQIKNISIHHKKDLHPLVTDLSFTLNDGDKAAIIGEEGNGKSTLLKLLHDPALVTDYVEYEGEIIKNHVTSGYLAQELAAEDKEKTVYEYLTEEPAFLETDYRDLASMAGKLGISADTFYSDTLMKHLSGGEKVKIQLVRILCLQPGLFLLDEPSNDIDMDTLEWLEEFINSCTFPVLYISHDETLLEHTANMIIHMEQLKRKTESRCTVFKTDYQDYVTRRQESFDRQERLAKEEKAAYEKQQEKFRRIYDKVEYQQDIISRQNPSGGRLLKKKMHAVKSMERRFERQAENMTQMPESEEAIFFRFAQGEGIPAGKWVIDYELPLLCVEDKELARNIRLQIRGPQKICIVGKNGTGKTTLLRKIAEQLLERSDIRAAYMPQNYEELLALDSTPVEYLSKSWDKEENTRIRTYLGSMKYTMQEMDHAIRDLSGGQKAKLLLLKMSMEHRNVLILDEPTRNFSPLSGPVIRRLLREFPGAIISVSHDRKYIREVCDRVLELDHEGLREKELG